MKKNSILLMMLEGWLTEYLPDQEGKRANTIKSYRDSWRVLVQFLYEIKGTPADQVDFKTLDYDTLLEFFDWLKDERKCSASTRNSRLAAITKFSEYAQNRDIDAASCFRTACAKLPYKKLSDAKERSYFTQVEIKIFLALPNIKDKTGYRDQVVLCILYASGMRAEEICALTVGDVSFLPDGKASILIHGKGGKSRRIKISEKPSAMLKKYISSRRISNQHERHIFSTQRNEMMSTSALEELFSKYVKRAKKQNEGLFLEETYTPHSMRHTTAVHMVEAGVPLLVIKQFLGHAHLSTTEIYAKMSQSSVNEKLKGWDEEYWHDQYIDSLKENNSDETSQSNIPDFLK